LECELDFSSSERKGKEHENVRYQDRNAGAVESTVKVNGPSLPGAVAKVTREFVKGLDRKQRFDMNKNGHEVTVKSVGTTTEAQPETSAEAAAG
jgi:hypothetical protein